MKSITIKALALVGGISITAIVVPSVTFAAVNNVNEQNDEMINNALNTIKPPTLTAEATQILPSAVNDKNINQYVVAPTVDSQTAQVTLSTKSGGADDTKGTLVVVVSVGWGSITQSKDFTLSGFEVSQNALSNDMKTALSLIQIKAAGATVLPSQITNSNISDYLVTPPTSANGTVFSLSIPTTNSYDNVNGTLNLILKGTLNGTSSSLDVSLASYNGISFLDNSTALSNALKNVTSLTTTSQISTILPGQITTTNLSTYINTPVATQDGLIIYSISNPTNANSASQSLEVTLTATLSVDGQSTSQNKLITITGFILPTVALTNALKNITTLSLTPAGESLVPSQITTQDQLNSAINIPSATLDGLITYSLSFPSTPSYDDTNGTLNVVLSANISGVTSQNKTIVVSGFHTASNTLINALNSITALTANAEGAKVMTSIVTANNLSTYVDTPANTSDNVSFTIALVPNSSDVATGTISIVLTAHFDSQTSSKTISVTGFLQSASAISDALAKITTLIANTAGSKVITPLVTTENLVTYTDTPTTTLDGVSFTIALVANSDNVTNGTLNVTLTATLGSQTDSKTISVTGFLTGSQALTNYLNAFGSGLTANATGAALLTTQVNKDLSNLNTYLNMPDLSSVNQNGLINYSFTNASDPESGSFKVDVNASLTGVTPLAPKEISLTGFLTANEALTTALQNITSLTTTSKAANTLPSILNNNNINDYINIPTALSNGITFSIQLGNINDATGTVNVVVQAHLIVNSSSTISITKPSAITVIGFLTSTSFLKNQINALNLQANTNMPAPVNTDSALALKDAQSILTTLNLTNTQISALNNISGLTISVVASSMANGTATLEFSTTINGVVATYSQSYSGFFKGSVSDVQTHLQTYLSDSTNVTSFLQNYLNLNQSFLNTLVINNLSNPNGSTYWSYLLSSSNNNNFNDITVSYDSTTKTYVLTAITANTIGIEVYKNGVFELDGSTIPIGTKLTITLPFVFSGTLNGGYSPLKIAVSDSGGITLSWDTAQFTSYQQTIGITTKYISKGSTTLQNLMLPWRTPVIPSIVF